jgi:hypothetical protein
LLQLLGWSKHFSGHLIGVAFFVLSVFVVAWGIDVRLTKPH